MASITFWMFPIAVIIAFAEWLKTGHGIDIAAMIEEWALANPEITNGFFEFINNAVNSLEDFIASLN